MRGNKEKEKERFESASPTTRVACRELSPALARLCSLALWLLRFAKTILNRFCSLALAGYPALKEFKARLRRQNKKDTRRCLFVLAEKERFEFSNVRFFGYFLVIKNAHKSLYIKGFPSQPIFLCFLVFGGMGYQWGYK